MKLPCAGIISVSLADGKKCHHLLLGDRFVTNLCFVGRDLGTVCDTLSGSGQLIAVDVAGGGLAAELQGLFRQTARTLPARATPLGNVTGSTHSR